MGGKQELGQLFRFDIGADRLELVYEASEPAAMEAPDNITPTPWGDLWVVEDGPFANRILGIDPQGDLYVFARVAADELAGPCFSPDGKTFFVNLYREGLTLAIWGPFPVSSEPAVPGTGIPVPGTAGGRAPKHGAWHRRRERLPRVYGERCATNTKSSWPR